MLKGLALRLMALLLVVSVGLTLPACTPQPRGGEKEEKGQDKEKKEEKGDDKEKEKEEEDGDNKEKKEDEGDDKEKKEE